VAAARFTIYVAPRRGRPGRPFPLDGEVEDDAHFGWRMLAANNREVARSPAVFDDVSACAEAVLRLRGGYAEAVVLSSRAGRAEWSWRLRLYGLDTAVSSRAYQRRLQCEAACALFLELVPEADVAEIYKIGHLVSKRRNRTSGGVVRTGYGAPRISPDRLASPAAAPPRG